jgi:8-oxo-dGTP diphosphatase
MKATTVTCAIIFFGEKILAVQRSRSMNQPMKWEFPGGKIEPGETEEQCIVREIREELNIEIRITGRLKPNTHDYGAYMINLIPFLAEYVSGEIKLKEHSHYVLMSMDELRKPDWAPADLPVVAQFLEKKIKQ